MVERKKKQAKKARQKHEKEMEIAQRVRAGENKSDVESEDPTEVGDDVISIEEEGGREVMTSTVRREPTAASASGGREAERRGDVPTPRKRATSSDDVGEREVKRTWSPRPSEASSALSPPALGVARQARRSAERARTSASSGLAPVCDPQQGDAPLATPVGAP